MCPKLELDDDEEMADLNNVFSKRDGVSEITNYISRPLSAKTSENAWFNPIS